MRVRIIHRTDGGVSIIHPAPKSRRENETEEAWLARVFAKATPEGMSYEDIDMNRHPLPDRTFRDAWTKSPNGGVMVNMGKAKAIHLDRWRNARKPLLEALDVEYMIALETDDKAKMAEIKVKKQALRDVTKADLSVIKTPDELKKVWPDVLRP